MKRNQIQSNEHSFEASRRTFLKQSGLLAFSASSLSQIGNLVGRESMGIVVHSYGFRWNSKINSSSYPSFTNAIDLLRHCAEIGAGGIQVVVNQWTSEFAKQVKLEKEKLNMFVEASIALPKSNSDLELFEKNIISAKEAGIKVARTVCLPTRRYETFKTLEEFKTFKTNSIASLQMVEPILSKHKVKLAVENHKDWKSYELVEIIKQLNSKYIGVTLDFGNNLALLEDPNEVIKNLAPFVFSTHVKDMGLATYEKGFLLAEVPLGKGMIDLKAAVDLCRKYNPKVTFNLEMITRDPLEIPCLENSYLATFENAQASDVTKALQLVKSKAFPGVLPGVKNLDGEAKLAFEEKNIIDCLTFAKANLNL
ncbi:sugar phosphate isomerase/epimerase [Sandaracinomonas limnophila]|uniref:Sugar phosphate isomerase/epimerase n=1 Tax=Sandaracinomonas limnophila TaxID=1862386 RepID=A0A437PMQ5_9BACT|nr:sugar phosphate isomerase/epimerase [Sandaracinomonas limnophila]RVU23552.1 sugar phosphate isomerase/epimerase [Sandaracinomonas limnophila]